MPAASGPDCAPKWWGASINFRLWPSAPRMRRMAWSPIAFTISSNWRPCASALNSIRCPLTRSRTTTTGLVRLRL